MKRNDILRENKEYFDNYNQEIQNFNLPPYIEELLNQEKLKRIIDLGCGEGNIVIPIINEYPEKNVTGIDISERRIKQLQKNFQEATFFSKNVEDLPMEDNSFDFAVSNQVIEHLPDDKKFLKEVSRILKLEGYFFISTVIKKPWAIYKYCNNGKFRLDPTHVREYKSVEEFLKLLKSQNFNKIKHRTLRVRRELLGIDFVIPGFKKIEVLCQNYK